MSKGVSTAAITDDDSGKSSCPAMLFQNTYALLIHFSTQKQYTVSNIFTHRFKVMICVVLSVGVVHSATQCNVNAKRFRNCSIYCKNTYFASGHKPSLLSCDTCTVNNDVTPSVATGMSKTFVKHSVNKNNLLYIQHINVTSFHTLYILAAYRSLHSNPIRHCC